MRIEVIFVDDDLEEGDDREFYVTDGDAKAVRDYLIQTGNELLTELKKEKPRWVKETGTDQ